jgi:hypothetical protein
MPSRFRRKPGNHRECPAVAARCALIINLVDANQLKQLRSREVFAPATDAFTMQQGVITEITGLLDMQLRPEAHGRLALGNTPVPGAYDYYLRGSDIYLPAGLPQTKRSPNSSTRSNATRTTPARMPGWAGNLRARPSKTGRCRLPDWR